MSSFNILDHLDSLNIVERHSSFIRVECPVCSGNLKINSNKSSSSYSAYKCWTNYCEAREIRKRLDVGYERRDSDSDLTSFSITSMLPPKVDFQWGKLCEVTDYKKPLEYSFYSLEHQNNIKLTYYYYTDKIRVKRLDIDSTKRKKVVILEAFVNGVWVSKDLTSYLSILPLYTNGVTFNGDTIFMSEGEKTTDYLCSLGFPCVTPCSIGFDLNNLTLTLLAYSKIIRNILYFPDWDETGIRKAKIVLHACFYVGVGARFVSLDTLFPTASLEEGMDLADIDRNLVKQRLTLYDY